MKWPSTEEWTNCEIVTNDPVKAKYTSEVSFINRKLTLKKEAVG